MENNSLLPSFRLEGVKMVQPPLREILHYLEPFNVEKVFKKSMHFKMMEILSSYYEDISNKELNRFVQCYLEEGKIYFDKEIESEYGFFKYSLSVLSDLNHFKEFETLTEAIKSKVSIYEFYLYKNQKRFSELDKIIRNPIDMSLMDEMPEIAKLMIEKPLIDLQLLNKELKELFCGINNSYLLRLLHPFEYQIYIDNGIDKYGNFDYKYYKDPPIYNEYPKEKESYAKFLKSWLIESLEKYNKHYGWKTLPKAFQIIKDYAESLSLSEELKEITNNNSAIFITEIKENKEYPKYLFLNDQAFQLFNLLMESFKTHATISFVYRIMAEKENPALIVAKDSPFRIWFNEQMYSVKLETHTKTYENAKSEDRIALYKIAKQMIYSES